MAALCLFGTTGVVLARGGAAATGGTVMTAAPSDTGAMPAPDGGTPHGKHHLRHRLAAVVLRTAAQELGMKPKDLVAELRGGKSLAQVAAAHGKTPAQVKSAILVRMREGLDKRVQAGKITQAQADEFLQRAGSRVDTLMNHVWKARPAEAPAAPGKMTGT